MRTATCHTPDCGNAEIPIEIGPAVFVDEGTGDEIPAGPVFCGVCLQEITDVTETP